MVIIKLARSVISRAKLVREKSNYPSSKRSRRVKNSGDFGFFPRSSLKKNRCQEKNEEDFVRSVRKQTKPNVTGDLS